MNYEKLVRLAMKVVDFLTLQKIIKVVLVSLLAIALFTLWENRQPLYKGIVAYNTQRSMIAAPITPLSKNAVQELLDKPTSIVAVQLVSVDFRTNTRSSEYFKSNIPALEKYAAAYYAAKIGSTPFFSDDPLNNQRNTSLINGEFVCMKIQVLPHLARIPELAKYADTVCSVSIPPYPGFFSGYVTLYLKGDPAISEISDLRAAIRKLALVTYDAEFGR